MAKVDVVVAVRNEEESLPVFVRKLRSLKIQEGTELGCIFIEDSSTDRTIEVLRELSEQDPSVRYLCLKKGRGQGPAIALGVRESKADAIIMMDVDGGHPLELIPAMIDAFNQGAVAVQAVRRALDNRKGYRNVGTRLFNWLYKIVTGIDTKRQNVFYRLIARPLAVDLLRDNRWKHFLRIRYGGLRSSAVTYVEFDALERTLGVSKYNLKRLVLVALDGVFASVSLLRFWLGMSAMIVASIALWLAHMPLLAFLVALLALKCVVKFARMYKNDVLALLEVKEASET